MSGASINSGKALTFSTTLLCRGTSQRSCWRLGKLLQRSPLPNFDGNFVAAPLMDRQRLADVAVRQVADMFYWFRLDDHVPADHRLRRIDALFDFGFVRDAMAASYSTTGRHSIDPELMLLFGDLSCIRSERRLCEEGHLNLAHRWFCRLDLADRKPDHSTFSKPTRLLSRLRLASFAVRADGQVRRGRAS